ncbi:outer membrane lipoprotein chaperone LolA [Fontimonas thermophila]|nr:outer membrane lipoprotein chaperone LolA [Fontimonas thermophila]
MIRIAVAAVLCLCSPLTFAASEAQARLQRFLTEVQTLSARFEQTQYDEHGAVLGTRSGEFVLARPGRFYWRYDLPYEQLMICDGKQIWNYEPDLAQATVRDADAVLRDTPASLLAQGERLDARFVIIDAGREGDSEKLRLEPRTADADIRLIELWLQASGVPVRMRFHDPLGGVSDIRFEHVQRNLRVDSRRFRFTPPAGVDVVQLD